MKLAFWKRKPKPQSEWAMEMNRCRTKGHNPKWVMRLELEDETEHVIYILCVCRVCGEFWLERLDKKPVFMWSMPKKMETKE